MEQGTNEWHQWRGRGIGSSDAAVIMGCDPYRTYEDLILDKLGIGKPFVTNPAIELGKKWESAAREIFNFKMDLELAPVTQSYLEKDFIRASFDGYDAANFIEIKYVGQKKFSDAIKHNKVPEHHWVQMQHQHIVALSPTHFRPDKMTAYYVPYTLNENKTAIDKIHFVEVPRDHEYISASLLPAELKFWEVLNERRKTG